MRALHGATVTRARRAGCLIGTDARMPDVQPALCEEPRDASPGVAVCEAIFGRASSGIAGVHMQRRRWDDHGDQAGRDIVDEAADDQRARHLSGER